MAGLIRQIATLASASYGVNILDEQPPGAVVGVGTNVVGVVVDLPWGAVNTPTFISISAELFETFAPVAFGDPALNAFQGLKAFLGKTFPAGIWVNRIAATGQAVAAFAFQATASDSVDATARHPGTLGNAVSVAWVVNADDVDARDAIVTVNGVSTTYLAVTTETGGLQLTDPGDPFVGFALASGATEVPDAIAATPLAGGLDGTAVALDYTGSVSSDVGIRQFYGESFLLNVLFVAECPTALVDAVNTSIKAYATDNDKGMALLCSTSGQTKADAKTYVATNNLDDDRLVFSWPYVNITNTFDSALGLAAVDPNSFIAAAIATQPPDDSPGGAAGLAQFEGIVSLVDSSANTTDLQQMNAAGVAPISRWPKGGFFLHRGVTTDITAGLTRIVRRRMADFIEDSIGLRLIEFLEKKLDIDLAGQSLGPVTSVEVGEIEQFLQGLQDDNRINGTDQVPGYAVDPFSANTQTIIDSGEWRIKTAVKLWSSQDVIVFLATIGETVTITEA